MNELIDTLARHHRNFERLLDIVETEIKVLENGGQPDYALLRNIMLYLTRYAVPFHDPAEAAIGERLLENEQAQQDLIRRLQEQQETVRHSGPALLSELDAVEAGAFILRAQIGAPGRIYAGALRRHMVMEEEELFPAARRLFEAGDWSVVASVSNQRPNRSDDRYRQLQESIVREIGCDCEPLAA
ncbi:MAG: hemerythrin domain-containing protein [Burkholderiales bacterium]